jgi:hypothetical protein
VVLRNLTFYNNAAAVEIGSTAPLICAGNKDWQSHRHPQHQLGVDSAIRSTTVRPLNNNTRPLDFVGNTVSNNLQCLNNKMLMMGGGNTAAITQGQCN